MSGDFLVFSLLPESDIVMMSEGRVIMELWDAYDDNLTDPSYRRQGIAKELLDRVVKEAKAYGCGV